MCLESFGRGFILGFSLGFPVFPWVAFAARLRAAEFARQAVEAYSLWGVVVWSVKKKTYPQTARFWEDFD